MALEDILGVVGTAASASPWGAAVSAIPSLFKLGSGLFQSSKARKLANGLNRPGYNPDQYQIPPEVQEYLNMTKNRIVDPRLPGQGLMEDKLSAITANAIPNITNPNQISDIYGKQMDNQVNLDIAGAQNYLGQTRQKESDVASALQYSKAAQDTKFAQDQSRYDKMFDYNQNQPFQDRSKAVQALTGAANQNIYGGLDDLSSLGSAIFMNKGAFAKKKRPTAPVGGYTDTINFDTSTYA